MSPATRKQSQGPVEKVYFPSSVGTWESSGTPENSKLNCRGQNTLFWVVLYTVRKVLKSRCRKWPRMSHLDICSTSYGKFSRRATSLLQTSSQSEVWTKSYELPKSRESKSGQFRDSCEILLGSPGKKMPLGCTCGRVTQRILYGGRWWLPPSSGRGEFYESKVARGLS
jgi:hypothetical protein